MSTPDTLDIHDLSEEAAHEIRDGFDRQTADRMPWSIGKVRVDVPSLKDENVLERDRELRDNATLHECIAFAGGRKVAYGFIENCIIGGLRFELLQRDGVYTGEAIVWDQYYRP